MRIALLSWETTHSIAVGGVAVHTSELAAALRRRQHDVHVFTRLGQLQSEYDRIDGVHYHRCAYEWSPDFILEIERMNDAFLARLRDVEAGAVGRFDIVHAHDWLCVRGLVRAKNELARAAVLTMHSTEYGRCGNQHREGTSRRIRDIEWEGTYVAERVICVSAALRREVQDLYAPPADKLHVVYNGVDVRPFDEPADTPLVRRELRVEEDAPLVLFVGRLTWQKGPDLLLQAVPQVLRSHPRTRFIFVGDGDMRGNLEARADAAGVGAATHFAGYRNGHGLVRLFQAADVVCVPSRNEPFGIVVLEAWSARKPVVATRNGGPAEFVRHGDTGLTVHPSPDSIGWGVAGALADKKSAGRLGRNGRREAEGRFSWDYIAAKVEQVYRSALGTRRPLNGRSSQRAFQGDFVRVTPGQSSSTAKRQRSCAVCGRE